MKDVSNLKIKINDALNTINGIMLNEMPDNNQQLIAASNTRNAGNAVADKISTTFAERLTSKVEMRIVEGYQLKPLHRTYRKYNLDGNTDKIEYTGNQADKLFIVKLPWNCAVHYINEWDNNEYMIMTYAYDDGHFIEIRNGLIFPAFVFYSDLTGKPFQYMSKDGEQTFTNTKEVYIPDYGKLTGDIYFNNSFSFYIISQFGNSTLTPAEYLPYLAVNNEIIYDYMTPLSEFDTTAVVDKYDFNSAKTYNIENTFYNYNLHNVISLLNSINKGIFKMNAKLTKDGIKGDDDSQISWMTINPGDLINAVGFKGDVFVVSSEPQIGSDIENAKIKKSGYDWITGNNKYEGNPNDFIDIPNSDRSVVFFNNTGSVLYIVWENKVDDIIIGNPDTIEINGNVVFKNDEWKGNVDFNANLNNWIKEIQYNREQINYLAEQIQRI